MMFIVLSCVLLHGHAKISKDAHKKTNLDLRQFQTNIKESDQQWIEKAKQINLSKQDVEWIKRIKNNPQISEEVKVFVEQLKNNPKCCDSQTILSLYHSQ